MTFVKRVRGNAQSATRLGAGDGDSQWRTAFATGANGSIDGGIDGQNQAGKYGQYSGAFTYPKPCNH